MEIRDEMGFFEMIDGMVNLKNLELGNTNVTLNSSTIKMIPSSVKDFKQTFCDGIYEESCDFVLPMENLNIASTIQCFDSIMLTNGRNMSEQIKKCKDEEAQIEVKKMAQINLRNGIIAACSVVVLLFCFFLAWKFVIVPKLPLFYR